MISAKEILKKTGDENTVKLRLVTQASWPKMKGRLSLSASKWAEVQGFKGAAGTSLQIPKADGTLAEAFIGSDENADGFAIVRTCHTLPAGSYAWQDTVKHMEIAWCLEAYGFDRYKTKQRNIPTLVCAKNVNYDGVVSQARATYLVRDLINTPANDMGPEELEAAARKVATRHKAKINVISGAALQRGFPMVYNVGKASPRYPRLIDFSWGELRAPKVTLVGKGVCFDTGGLDIKTASSMALMKKDMGGAANVLGLAQLIMDAKLPVRLRVIIPAVENVIAGNAFRPGDILKSRKGLTIEIGNTDAEGRLVLGDALSLADEHSPDLLIDMATLTGAARVALGPDLPPFYTTDDNIASDIARHSASQKDPLWRLPFWEPYYSLFESSVADMNNSSDSGYAGSVTAALFLKRFVERAKSYVHFDIFGWTPSAKPGFPRGGEAQGIRALFAVIADRYRK
jgi:leucyl aminopeptidase